MDKDQDLRTLQKALIDLRKEVVGVTADSRNDVIVYLKQPIDLGNDRFLRGVMPSSIGADGIILDVPNRFMPGRKTVLEEPYIQGESDGQVKTLMFVTGEQINEATKQIQTQKREGNFRPVVLIEAKYSNYFQYVAMMGQPLDSVAVSSYLKNGDVQKVDKANGIILSRELHTTGELEDFHQVIADVADSYLHRNQVRREGRHSVIVLDGNNKSNIGLMPSYDDNIPFNREGLAALEMIAKMHHGQVESHPEEKVSSVRFGSVRNARQFELMYFTRHQLAQESVSKRVNDEAAQWSDNEKTILAAHILEKGGYDVDSRKLSGSYLINDAMQKANIPSNTEAYSYIQTIEKDLDSVAVNVPMRLYVGREAQEVLGAILDSGRDGENGKETNYPLHPEAVGYFKDGEKFVAFDNTTQDCWVEEFKNEDTAKMWINGHISADEGSQIDENVGFADSIYLSEDSFVPDIDVSGIMKGEDEIEVNMLFMNGIAKEIHPDGSIVKDGLEMHYPTLQKVSNDDDIQASISEFTGREWRKGSLHERLYDIALFDGTVTKESTLRSLESNNTEVVEKNIHRPGDDVTLEGYDRIGNWHNIYGQYSSKKGDITVHELYRNGKDTGERAVMLNKDGVLQAKYYPSSEEVMAEGLSLNEAREKYFPNNEPYERAYVKLDNDSIAMRRVHGGVHDDPALIFSLTEYPVYFHDVKEGKVVEVQDSIDLFADKEGHFLVKDSDYEKAYRQVESHDRGIEHEEYQAQYPVINVDSAARSGAAGPDAAIDVLYKRDTDTVYVVRSQDYDNHGHFRGEPLAVIGSKRNVKASNIFDALNTGPSYSFSDVLTGKKDWDAREAYLSHFTDEEKSTVYRLEEQLRNLVRLHKTLDELAPTKGDTLKIDPLQLKDKDGESIVGDMIVNTVVNRGGGSFALVDGDRSVTVCQLSDESKQQFAYRVYSRAIAEINDPKAGLFVDLSQYDKLPGWMFPDIKKGDGPLKVVQLTKNNIETGEFAASYTVGGLTMVKYISKSEGDLFFTSFKFSDVASNIYNIESSYFKDPGLRAAGAFVSRVYGGGNRFTDTERMFISEFFKKHSNDFERKNPHDVQPMVSYITELAEHDYRGPASNIVPKERFSDAYEELRELAYDRVRGYSKDGKVYSIPRTITEVFASRTNDSYTSSFTKEQQKNITDHLSLYKTQEEKKGFTEALFETFWHDRANICISRDHIIDINRELDELVSGKMREQPQEKHGLSR